MNKRIAKKRQMKYLDGDMYYIKVPINENDDYNPIVKCKGFRKFRRELNRLFKQHPNIENLLISREDTYD
jgi:shikimate kinase